MNDEEQKAYRELHDKRHPRPEPDWHWTDTRLHCCRELGYALIYMKYLHPDWDLKQLKRVKRLCREVAALRGFHEPDQVESDKYNQIEWYRLYQKIEDEIENMC